MGSRKNVYLLLILAMLAWGSLYPVSKYLMADISPLFLALLRYTFATASLLPFFIIEIAKNNNKFDIKSIINFSVSGIFGITLFSVFLFFGISLSTASKGSILTNTQPVFTAILAPLFLGERLSGTQAAGIAAGLIGIILVVTGGNLEVFSGEGSVLTGSLLLICGAVSMSLYSILLKSSIQKYGGIIATWLSMAAGTLFLLLINIITGSTDFNILAALHLRDLLLIIYMGVIATAIAYLLFNLSLKKIDVVKATGFKFLIPVSGVGLSILFIGERPAITLFAGIIIVIFSVFLIQNNNFSFSGKKIL